jgi:two-component system, cell cycle sensor histidine kinase and response regulator CckA
MNHSKFSPVLESLEKAIDIQKAFNDQHSMSDLSALVPKILAGDRKDDLKNSLIYSLHETLKQHMDFVETVPIGLMVQRHGKILATNAEFRQLYGYDRPEELIGRPVMDLVAPEFQSVITSEIHQIAEEGKKHAPPMEVVGIKRNGERIYVEGEAMPIIHEGEEAIVVILRDISQKKIAQAALRKSEENFQNMIRQMPDGVLIMGEDQLLFANDSLVRMLGYDFPEELKGMMPSQFIHPDYRAMSSQRTRDLFTEGGAKPLCKFKLLGIKGQVVDVESSAIAIEYYGQRAVMAVLRDITLQNQIERQAVLNDKLATLGTLAAGVAHEVNNPLTYVLGNLAFLKEQVDEIRSRADQSGMDETGKKILVEMAEEINDITQGGERIRDIVRGLKSFSRGGEEKVEKVDLNQAVESAINMTFHVMKQKARLEKDLAVDLPALNINSGKLQQVFINLFINASQAIAGNHPSENKISVHTGRQDGNLFVEITDTGKGIPQDILPRIFDPFFTTKPVGVGTGLGLAVCNEILQHYLGTIEVSSQVGKGTTFRVTLPLDNGMAAGKAAPMDIPAAMKLGRVLVVDDEPSNLEVISRSLKKDYEVLSALSGMEAMAILEKGGDQVDVIVSDINMPEMDGMALYRTVALVFPGMEKKMVFITGGIFSDEVNRFMGSIPNYCLEKPFNQQDLRAAVSQCVVSEKTGA